MSFRKSSMDAVDPDVLLRDISKRKSLSIQKAGKSGEGILPIAEGDLQDLIMLKMKIESQGDEAKRISSEVVLRVLNDDETRDLLEKFLTKEFAEESFHFWVEVTKFKEGGEGKGIEAQAKDVFKEFVKQGSNQQINIPSSMVKTVKKALDAGGDNVTLSIFDDALKEVVAMLARDKLRRFLNDESVTHRQDILVSDQERNLKAKYEEIQEKLSAMALLSIKRAVVTNLKRVVEFHEEVGAEVRRMIMMRKAQSRNLMRSSFAENMKGKGADIVSTVNRLAELMVENGGIFSTYNHCTSVVKMEVLLDALSRDVDLKILLKELKRVIGEVFKSVADVIRVNGVKGTEAALSALRFVGLQGKANSLISPLKVECPLSAIEIAVHMCKDRDLVGAEKVVEELVLTMRTRVNIWADYAMKEAIEPSSNLGIHFPNTDRLEDLCLLNIDENSIRSYLGKYQNYVEGISSQLEGDGEEEQILVVKLMTEFMRKTVTPDVQRRTRKGAGGEGGGGDWEAVTEQGALCSGFFDSVTRIWGKLVTGRRWNNRSTLEAFLIQCVLVVVDDFLRWCNEVYSKLYSSIESEALRSHRFSKMKIENMCMVGCDCDSISNCVGEFLDLVARENATGGGEDGVEVSVLQQKCDSIALLACKSQESVGELSAYIAQCICEKNIARHHFNEGHGHGHGLLGHSSRKSQDNGGIGILLVDNIFKSFDDISGGKIAIKLSFCRVLETFLEHLSMSKCMFNIAGANRLHSDFEKLVDWCSAFDAKHGTDCLGSGILDRAHAIVVVLGEPAVSTFNWRLMVCAAQLLDLEFWISMRTDKGRGHHHKYHEGGAGGGGKDS
ncbi:hypothetical protein TrRE_jg7143, partial [Triparma retinervis]